MQLTAEISMYLLQEKYEQPILDFIADLQGNSDIDVSVNAMSTQVCGPYDQVFPILQEAMKRSFARSGKSVMVVKFIPDQLSILEAPKASPRK